MSYTGSVDLISGLRPKNNGDFPLVHAKDVYIDDDTRLDAFITSLLATITDLTQRVEALEEGSVTPPTPTPATMELGTGRLGEAVLG